MADSKTTARKGIDESYHPCNDAEVMRLWREAGLPEYFLGNGGTNHKLVAFARLIRDTTKRQIDIRMNDHLCEMKPDFDDSIVGFNEAWDIARDIFAEAMKHG